MNSLPPVICSIDINNIFIGHFDNPFALEKGIDQFLGKKFISFKVSIKKGNYHFNFSVINQLNEPIDLLVFDKSQIKTRKDIKETFDSVIDMYKNKLGIKESNEDDKEWEEEFDDHVSEQFAYSSCDINEFDKSRTPSNDASIDERLEEDSLSLVGRT